MKSKIINLRHTKYTDAFGPLDKHSNVLDEQYINRLNSSAVLTSPLGFYAGSTGSNILDYHMHKDVKLDFSSNQANLHIKLNEDPTNTWNSLAIQLNKLNKTFMADIMPKLGVDIEIRDAADVAVLCSISLYPSISTDTFSLNNYSSGKIGLKDGLFLIDTDMIKAAGHSNFPGDCNVHILFTNFFKNSPFIPVSNISINNFYLVELDEKASFKNINLNQRNFNKKTGVTFQEINESKKEFDAKISLMTSKEQQELYANVIDANKDTPFFLFPFCETGEITNYDMSLFNYTAGGLYLTSLKYDMNHDAHDVYNTSLKLDEWR